MYADRMTLTRTTVNLVPKAVKALNAASERTGDSRTDTINRAIQLYDMITGHVADGRKILVWQSDGTTHEMIIL